MVFDDDGQQTSITEVTGLGVIPVSNGCYTIDGRRVTDSYKGLIINNGRKELRK